MTTTLEREIVQPPEIINIEDLGSVGILRVLATVTKDGPLNISQLGRKTGLNHGSCDQHVRKLADMGLVEEERYGEMRMIRTTFDSLAVVFKKGMGVRITRA